MSQTCCPAQHVQHMMADWYLAWTTDEHFIDIDGGIVRARAIRRMVKERSKGDGEVWFAAVLTSQSRHTRTRAP